MAGNDDRIEYLSTGNASDAVDPSDFDDLDDLRALLADPTMWDEPSAGLGDDIVALISSAAAEQTRGAAPVEADRQIARPVSLAARRAQRLRLVGSAVLGAAAATIIAVAVVRSGDDSGANRSADGVVQMAGTAQLPGATGKARIEKTTSGVRIELDVPGLPRRDGTDFYEAWLKSVDGTGLIPIGTFHDADKVTVWAGVDIDQYPIITITRESVAGPQDPAQGSSGDVVASGRLQP